MTESAPQRPDTSDMAPVHAVFRSSLASGPGLVASAAGDDERRALIANYYANVMAFLKVHHDGEEAIVFPLLVERDPAHRSLVDAAAGEHLAVVARMQALDEAIDSWATKGDAEAPRMVHSLEALDDVLTPHLDREEAEIVPMAAEHLTVEEWGSLPGHAMGHFEGDKVWLIIGLIRENFTQEQRDLMLANMPPPARQMWETMGQTSFDDLIVRVRESA